MGLPTLTDQIKRMTKDWYNFTEPSAQAVITAINSDDTVNLNINGADIPRNNVPVLKPCYDSPTTMNLNINDNVVVIFLMGHIANPVVVGKY